MLSLQSINLKQILMDLVSDVPVSKEIQLEVPEPRVKELIFSASVRSASAAGIMGLAPGPWGLLTILPDLINIWRIQRQLVADIAAVYGKTSLLSRDEMLLCLFKHGSASLFRDVVIRAGEKFLIRRTTLRTFQSIAQALGIRVTQRFIGQGIARWLPVAGALAVAAYARYDTKKVGESAQELFSSKIEIQKAA